jgi:predicted nucleic-acid-binding protein
LDRAGTRKVYVNLIVVVELVWTLRRVYRFERDQIATVLRKLTEHPNILVQEKDILREAAHRSREHGGDVADHLIALLNEQLDCSTTYTFDEDAAKSEYFTLLS